MRNARAEHLLQWVYAYVMLILGVLAIGTSAGRAGGTTLVDALLATPPGQRDPIALQGSQECSIHNPSGKEQGSCSKEPSADLGSTWREADA